MRLIRMASTVLVAGLILAPAASASPTPDRVIELFVAPEGNGRQCIERAPCSLQTVLDKLTAFQRMHRDVVVTLAGGSYRLEETVELGDEHTPADGYTITWRAAAGQTPVLSGGVVLDGWTATGQDGVWSAPVPDGLRPRQLYVDGARAIRAQGPTCDRATECSWTPQGLAGAAAARYAGLAKPEDLEFSFPVRWRNYRCGVDGVDGDVIRMEQPCWVNSSTAKHRMAYNWGSTTLDGTRYSGPAIVENAREFLDEPGEFYVDSDSDVAYYLPRDGEDMASAEVVAPRTQTLLRLEDMADVVITGLTFAHTGSEQPNTSDGYSGAQAGLTITGADGPQDLAGELFTRQRAAVEIVSGERVVVTGSTFEHLGAAGVDVRAASRHTAVTDSTFRDVSGGAVYVGDVDADATGEAVSRNNEVSGNHISDIGLEFTDSVAIWGGYERETVIAYNTIERVPYSGISLGWGWTAVHENPMRDNRITGNRIVHAMGHDVGMHDGGAIYTQGIQPGTVISGNYINRVEYPDRDPALDGNGIYLDERSSFIEVTGNVITRVGGKWVSNWATYGQHNRAHGNWSDLVSPALSGVGSVMEDNDEGLAALPAEAIAVARAAGSEQPGTVEQLLHVVPGLTTSSGTEVTVTLPNTTDETYTDATVSLTVPDGWSAGPDQAVESIAPHSSASVTFDVAGPAGSIWVTADASYTVAGAGAGLASGEAFLDSRPLLPSFEAAFNIVATTDDAEPGKGTLTDSRRSYSAQALAAAGISPGATLEVGVTWPDAAPGEPNGVFADGQVFALSGQGSALTFVGAAAYGGHSGEGVVYYTDGTAAPFTIGFPDWFRTDQGQLVATMPYSNAPSGRFDQDAGLFYDTVALDPARTVRAVRLPDSGTPSGPGLRVLAVGID